MRFGSNVLQSRVAFWAEDWPKRATKAIKAKKSQRMTQNVLIATNLPYEGRKRDIEMKRMGEETTSIDVSILLWEILGSLARDFRLIQQHRVNTAQRRVDN